MTQPLTDEELLNRLNAPLRYGIVWKVHCLRLLMNRTNWATRTL